MDAFPNEGDEENETFEKIPNIQKKEIHTELDDEIEL